MDFKGIILAGGTGSRLWPTTLGMSKHLLPIYDKPLIYYPISVLMLASIREILIITTPNDLSLYKRILGDGSKFGLNLSYVSQKHPAGIADALIVAEDFIKGSPVVLALGDNLFYGQAFSPMLANALSNPKGATVFAYPVKDPTRFGIVEVNDDGRALSLEEKPLAPRSNFAVTGLYFYDQDVCDIAKEIKPSERGELEITDVNKVYLERGELKVNILGRGFTWMDTGTPQAMLEATHFIQTIQSMQGFYIACLEELGLKAGWLTPSEITKNMQLYTKSDYGKYVLALIKGKKWL